MKFFRTIFLIFLVCSCSNKDNGKWQQHVSYKMVIDVDAENRSYSGTQELVYTNNSSDTISRVFYHLYFNAFQQGSMMDVRSRTIKDPDKRVGDRISNLKTEETGYQKINSLKIH